MKLFQKIKTKIRPPRCGFCGKSLHKVAKLVAGPKSYICGDCVAYCDLALQKDWRKRLGESTPPKHYII